ncbi:MAG: HlyD family efflux transporter periplasmic adaptor subunit [Candidatus Delongbacteria bacterium]|jgi:HlyD family secretion protein|nr:HlyD family efflux transporter periplasmic adaptor subunit [Candidatus Delongbacteria bacterium]
MKMKLITLVILGIIFVSCTKTEITADAYGNFEAVETIISAEAQGKLLKFNINEGEDVKIGQSIGLIDTSMLVLQRNEISANLKALKFKLPDVSKDIKVLEQQIANIEVDRKRTENLLEKKAATQKQYDDIIAQMEVLKKQVTAAKYKESVQSKAILSEIEPIEAKLKQINYSISKCRIINPVPGTVISKFVEESEIVSFGKPLYKIADLENIILRVYVSAPQMINIKLGAEVKVLVDAPNDSMKEYTGTISWISSKAEFTPKIIQTKEERTNLVYAVKIAVKNDGGLKLGMPGEVYFP